MGWMVGPEEVANSLKLAPSGWQKGSIMQVSKRETERMYWSWSKVRSWKPKSMVGDTALSEVLTDCGTRAVTVARAIKR